MDSKLFFSLFLVFSSWAFVGFSQNLDEKDLSQLESVVSQDLSQGLGGLLQAAGGGGDPVSSLPCIQKLLPCQPYLRSPSPPALCCVPLKEMVINDSQCLCTVFNNNVILKSLNITKDDAMKLSEACHANADISVCKNETASPTSSPAPSSPETPETPANDSNESSPISAAYGITHFGGSGFVALFIALFV